MGHRGDNNEFIPSLDDRCKVQNWVFAGVPIEVMATLLEIDDETLTKKFAKELKTGKSEKIVALANTAIKRAIVDESDAMLKYLLSTRGHDHGFTERTITESADSAELEDLRKRTEQLEKKHEAEF